MIVQAVARLADNPGRLNAVDGGLEQAAPYAPIDLGELGPATERPLEPADEDVWGTVDDARALIRAGEPVDQAKLKEVLG